MTRALLPNARLCDRCGEPATCGESYPGLCLVHRRFRRMQHVAKSRGKVVPSLDLLESLRAQFSDMRCPGCARPMTWTMKPDKRRQLTLQHYDDGSIGFLCHGCNARHGSCGDAEFFELGPDLKRCRGCRIVKPRADFPVVGGFHFPRCRPCSNAYWRKAKRRAKAS